MQKLISHLQKWNRKPEFNRFDIDKNDVNEFFEAKESGWTYLEEV